METAVTGEVAAVACGSEEWVEALQEESSPLHETDSRDSALSASEPVPSNVEMPDPLVVMSSPTVCCMNVRLVAGVV